MSKSHGWEEYQDLADNMRSVWRAHGFSEQKIKQANLRVFQKNELRVIMSMDEHIDGKSRMHISISCEKRYPTWEELKDARYSLMPLGALVAQLLPPPNEYVNIHQNCFHLYEIIDTRVDK